MAAALRIAPIPSDMLDDWRSFQAELAGPRRIAWVQSQRRRGIRREVVWVDPDACVAYYLIEAADPDAAMVAIGTPADAFESWYRERLEQLHPDGMATPQAVFDSSPKPGAWRGLAGRW